ncbi:hypothetical protein [Microbacterium sp. NPDC089696]|uniref:hypothetical protein n=1 Tax=Microbacterium sp. NPDC089696 TaxID=3364199 RepID=UPI0038018092
MNVVKAGDRETIQWRANADLTGAQVALVAELRGTRVPIPLETEMVDATNGLVAHTLTGELAVGTYRVVLRVTRGSGTPLTFPREGYATLTVQRSL